MYESGRDWDVSLFFEYLAGNSVGFGLGGGKESAGSPLLRRADERSEKTVGQRVYPRVHGNHIGIDDAGVGGIDPNATGTQLLGQPGCVEGESEFRLAVSIEPFVTVRSVGKESLVDFPDESGERGGGDDAAAGVHER